MNSRRTYLIRASYQWIVDNQCTPFFLVDATQSGTHVPDKYVEEGRIVLNVGPNAVQGLEFGDESISFSARFDGSAMQISFPPAAVKSVYARENPEIMGMVFPDLFPEEAAGHDSPDPAPDSGGAPGKRPSLKVVK